MGRRGGAALVFLASGAVLVLEILSLRLVAPYVGLTLETSTAVIGFALAAISAGAWLGGRAADRTDPRRVLGPLVLAAGVLVLIVGPAVRWTGEAIGSSSTSSVLVIAAITVFPPAALLSAVTPLVVKLRLDALSEAGEVVGRLSGIATLGALVATFATGFLLVAAVPTSITLLALGLLLVGLGGVLTLRSRGPAAVWGALLLAVLGVVAMGTAPTRCEVETAYHCAQVLEDPERPTGRTLELDTLSHSYVDLADPTYLSFTYIRAMASVIDVMMPTGSIRALHLGGGGMTLPRYLKATRWDSRQLVFEIDRAVVDLDIKQLGLRPDERLEVRVEDARVGLRTEGSSTRDIVVGDAFAGLTVPWHLTTREAAGDVRRVLSPAGIYVMNLIDYPPLRFGRAQLATLDDVFPHVTVFARPEVLQGLEGGNLVLLGSERPIPVEAIRYALTTRSIELDLLANRAQIERFIGGASVLTDDYAPIDQLHTAQPSY